MSNQDNIALLRAMAGQANTITIPKVFCQCMDSLEGGAFLNQLIFWSDKGRDGWFYKSYEEWKQEIMLSQYQVAKATRFCEEQGFLTTELKKANGAPTLHYFLDIEKFSKWIMKFLIIDNEKFDNPLLKNQQSYKQKNTTEDHLHKKEKEHTPPPAKEPPHPMTRPILDAYIECLGYTPTKVMIGRDSRAAKDMAQRGFTPEDVHGAYPVIKSDSFWKHKTVSLNKVLETLLETKLTMRNNGGNNGQAGGANEPTDAEYEGIIELKRQAKLDPSRKGEVTAAIRALNEKYYGVPAVQGDGLDGGSGAGGNTQGSSPKQADPVPVQNRRGQDQSFGPPFEDGRPDRR